MADMKDINPAAFPILNDAQIARVANYGPELEAKAGDILYDLGDAERGVFVVLQGSIQVLNVSNAEESVLRILNRGDFTGEVNQLSGRRSLVRCRAREASEVIELGRSCLREIMQTDVALGELFLKAFVMRRVYLIANSVGDAVLIGSSH